jgi:hypothetical protein
MRKRMGSTGLSGRTRKPEETIGDATQPAGYGPNGTRLVTLIYMSFTNRDISITIAGCGVTLEAGKNGA